MILLVGEEGNNSYVAIIPKSENVKRLQCGNPRKLNVIGYSHKRLQDVRDKFDYDRLSRVWFRKTPAICNEFIQGEPA